MADVAARAGVSRTLVSLIFRNEPGAGERTRERVLRAADELGYRPDSAARLLARGRSRTIGVVVRMDQPFQAELVNGMYPEAERLGYDVLLSASGPGRDERTAADALLGHRCEALILLGPKADARFLPELAENAVVVTVGCRVPGARADSVHTADARGMGQAVDHLVELGHRRIAHVDGGRDPGSADRRRGYRSAMRRRGLGDEIRVVKGAHNEDAGMAAGRALLDDGPLPTALIAGNDRCAMGLMHVLRRAGVETPGDLSVVGYDDSRLAHLSHIDLTTVHQDADRMAVHAVRAAVHRLENPGDDPREIVVEPRLVVRGTTGPCGVTSS
ncbi:LacI family DNA-binding transcriptional regulator [Saccharopolyspora taberi]|uniref:LacI family DNA-binding transcriptional regulator n=2 Tax=Saccharopolyspora taberi TaxID=60895 RepID=A0ABN3VAD4_9PSEU